MVYAQVMRDQLPLNVAHIPFSRIFVIIDSVGKGYYSIIKSLLSDLLYTHPRQRFSDTCFY